MANELVINATKSGHRIALLKEGELLEYHIDEKDSKFTVGDIFLGIIKKLVPGLNAAFVDIGYEKDAFLHYVDLGQQFNSLNKFTKLVKSRGNVSHDLGNFNIEPDIDKLGKVSQVLSKNQHILVQVAKEPISNKGPRLSCELSMAGRYVILVPFTNAISISRKIAHSEEKKRLVRLISSIKPKNFGVIIRTVAEGKEVAELDKDFKYLLKKWEEGIKKLKTAIPRDKIIGEVNRTTSILRDMLNESFDHVVVDDKKIYEETKHYIKNVDPKKEKIVKLYQGRIKLFEQFGIERQIRALFGQTVNFEGGGYLVIEHTEAMHVIDVNSGHVCNVEEDQEATALNVNLAAAKEVTRQLRLRDMGGIIVVDFIDMKRLENRRHLYQKMKDYMKDDRSKVTLLPLSRFGLMQITRQRVRPAMSVITKELCPTCGGTGKIDASILTSDRIEKNLKFILMHQNEYNITVFVHPYLYAYFTKGFFSRRVKWLLKYKKWIKLKEDSALGVTDFRFVNKESEEIELN